MTEEEEEKAEKDELHKLHPGDKLLPACFAFCAVLTGRSLMKFCFFFLLLCHIQPQRASRVEKPRQLKLDLGPVLYLQAEFCI